jgi:SAM-dependent methyltransferase
MSHDPTPRERFSSRVVDYVRSRPGYPPGVIGILEEEIGLCQGAVLADIGSGTGLSAEPFLREGYTVHCVEPNRAMREAGEAYLGRYPGFHSVDGTAEATGLAAQSVDYVLAAQAFHWFDRPRVQREFARILRPSGWVVLLWNTRRIDGSPFLRAFEALLQAHGTDYREVRHANIKVTELEAFFAPGMLTRRVLDNVQHFDREGLRTRLSSMSYTPAPDDPRHAPMMAALDRLFDAHQVDGRVSMEYDTEVYFGRLR